jgi:hypothetical protein
MRQANLKAVDSQRSNRRWSTRVDTCNEGGLVNVLDINTVLWRYFQCAHPGRHRCEVAIRADDATELEVGFAVATTALSEEHQCGALREGVTG